MSADITIDQPTVRQVDLERIRNAQKKRNTQLKLWAQYDRKMELENAKRKNKGFNNQSSVHITFPQDIVLMEATFRGDLDELRRLLEQGICPDVVNADGLTVLHQSCIDNNIEMCKLLLDFGADVNAKDQEMWTPLHVAAACPHPDLCKFLIDNGADLLALNADGNMPYDICEDDKALTIIENEMAAKNIQQSDIDEKRKVPERMMIYEVEQAYKEGRDLDQLDKQGAAYIHIAASCGYADVVSNLMDHGANIDVRDKDGWKAIHVAAYWSHIEVINVLCNYGADIDSKTTNGDTVFTLCQDEEMAQRLIELKRDIERMKINNQLLNTTKGNEKTKGLIRRRSSNNPRGSSIRRTSMREKKAISQKEAREEGSIFHTKGLPVHPKELNLTVPSVEINGNNTGSHMNSNKPGITIHSPSTIDKTFDSNHHHNFVGPSINGSSGAHGSMTGLNTPNSSDYANPRASTKPNGGRKSSTPGVVPPALPPGGHRSTYAVTSPNVRTSLEGLLPKIDPTAQAPSSPRAPTTPSIRDNRLPLTSRKDTNSIDSSPEFIYRPPVHKPMNNNHNNFGGSRSMLGPVDNPRSPIPPHLNAYNNNNNNFNPRIQMQGPNAGNGAVMPGGGGPRTRNGSSGRIPYGYEDNYDEKRKMAQSGKCCLIM